MKIAYILYPEVIISNKSNGVRSQAQCWAESLEKQGHQVDLISNWGNYNWKEYDAIHLFGSGGTWVKNVARRLRKLNPNIHLSPIIDPQTNKNQFLKYCRTHLGKWTGYLCNITESQMYQQFEFVKLVFARSEHEKQYLQSIYNVPSNRIALVPLSFSAQYEQELYDSPIGKEDFCLHISSIYQERKNVIRLVEAAKKYNFRLVLAGNKGSEEQFKPIKEAIGESKNIEVLGFISEEEKLDLYKKAKVFALPSIQEGVGIVAVDAALFGAEIVITNTPGPGEYYGDMALTTNPYNMDEIGLSVRKFLDGEIAYQPELSRIIRETYSPTAVAEKIISEYKRISI